jgi:RNA polymerase sigma-70 factor (sigma-E family)
VDRAFEQFAAARLPALLGYARALTAGSAAGRDAEDLVQEALARTGAAWWRVRRQDDPEAYVRRTMLRLTLNRWRRPHREVSVGEPPERGADDPGMRLVESDLAVDDLLRALPPRMRVVLVLRYVDGLADDVIADRLGISAGTVRSQAHRALAHVRAGLAAATQELARDALPRTTEVGRGRP